MKGIRPGIGRETFRAVRMLLFLLLLTMLMPMTGPAAHGAEYYTTQAFDVTMDVRNDNSFLMKEEIQVTFTEPRHGIYRYIPLSGTAYSQVDGQVVEQKYQMKVDQVRVEGYELNTYTENGNLVMQIGSPDYYVDGSQTYVISYRVRLFDDGISQYDSLYYNVLPFDWGTSIDSAEIRIQMPKEFDQNKAEFLVGGYGSVSDDRIRWSAAGTSVQGTLQGPLQLGEGVTFRVVLPEGYFVGEMNNNWALALMLLLMVAVPLVSFLLFLFFGRDPRVVQTVEFYPPEGISPAEVGYIVDGMVDQKDLVSLVIYFAEKGYLTIEELEDKSFVLRKEKELPETAKTYEYTFFDGLFKEGDSVMLEDLKGEFYGSYQASGNQLRSHFGKKKETRVFTHSSLGARSLGTLLMLIPLVAGLFLGAVYAMNSGEFGLLGLPGLFLVLAGYLVMIIGHDKRDAGTLRRYRLTLIVGGILTSLGFLVLAGFMLLALELPLGILSLVASFISFVFTLRMKQRTRWSAEILGKILGFKEFIRTAELPRIQKLVDENPSYFYDVLPYAYVLGLSDRWAKKFEGIAMEPPVWYNGSGNTLFNTWVFMNAFNGFSRSMASSMVPPTPKGGDGGLGGGGFSGGGGFGGGGFGGGGGGSW